MNNKKMIFLWILGFFVVIVIIIAIFLWKQTEENKKTTAKYTDFKIWILDDTREQFNAFLENFKKDTNNSNFSVTIETFKNYEEYNMALSSAIIKGEAPDLYMLNNNEKSIFLENAIWIDPDIISADDLRTYFYWFFWDDLIYSSWEKEQKVEFLVWVPFWFETLGLYYNFQRVNDVKKLKSFPELQNYIEEFHDNKPGLTALWIGMWSTVRNSSDIFSQFLMAENANWIDVINSSNIKKSFSEYFSYNWWDNWYVKADNILKEQWKTNLDYFIDWEIAMIFWYPRLLNDIDERGFKKQLLRAVNFPEFINDSKKMVNYNYFVLNKDSKNRELSYALLKYMFSEEWQLAYLNEHKYYLPWRISLYSEVKNIEINDSFYIKLKDFFNSEAEYSSFDKWLKVNYDRSIVKLLDDEVNYSERASNFISMLKCKTSKITKLENLSDECE